MPRRILLILFLLAQSGCAAYLVVSGGEVNPHKLDEVKSGVAALRGLEFKADVPVEVKNQESLRHDLERELEREYGDEKLENLSLAYAKLGLLPGRLDLKKVLLDFYAAHVAAFYDAKEKKLVLSDDLGGGLFVAAFQFLARRDFTGEMVLAHELTHALQDQHFALGERVLPSTDDDRTLAFRALAEGDATLSGFEYLFGGMDESAVAQVKQAVQDSLDEARRQLSQIPRAIVEQLLFQYYGGVAFVSRVLGERGWLGVNRVYAFPPLSTEQLLHPEKYFSEPDPPTRIELSDSASLFSSGWQEIENNVLGEMMVEVLFRGFLSEAESKGGASGWDGDRFIAFRRSEEVFFVWATLWDSVEDAEEFRRGYEKVLSAKYGSSQVDSTHLERRGSSVLIIEGLTKTEREPILERVWAGMRLEEEPFKRPFPPLPSRGEKGYDVERATERGEKPALSRG